MIQTVAPAAPFLPVPCVFLHAAFSRRVSRSTPER